MGPGSYLHGRAKNRSEKLNNAMCSPLSVGRTSRLANLTVIQGRSCNTQSLSYARHVARSAMTTRTEQVVANVYHRAYLYTKICQALPPVTKLVTGPWLGPCSRPQASRWHARGTVDERIKGEGMIDWRGLDFYVLQNSGWVRSWIIGKCISLQRLGGGRAGVTDAVSGSGRVAYSRQANWGLTCVEGFLSGQA